MGIIGGVIGLAVLLTGQFTGAVLKARINSIGKARENSIVEKDAKKIKKC